MKKILLIALFAATSAFAQVDQTENMDKMDKAAPTDKMSQMGHGANDPHAGLPSPYVGTTMSKNDIGLILGYHHGPYLATEAEISRSKDGGTKFGVFGHAHPIPALLPLFSVSVGAITEGGRVGFAYGIGQDFKVSKRAFVGVEYRRDHIGGTASGTIGLKTHIHFD